MALKCFNMFQEMSFSTYLGGVVSRLREMILAIAKLQFVFKSFCSFNMSHVPRARMS